jgi:hypothetical protein
MGCQVFSRGAAEVIIDGCRLATGCRLKPRLRSPPLCLPKRGPVALQGSDRMAVRRDGN